MLGRVVRQIYRGEPHDQIAAHPNIPGRLGRNSVLCYSQPDPIRPQERIAEARLS